MNDDENFKLCPLDKAKAQCIYCIYYVRNISVQTYGGSEVATTRMDLRLDEKIKARVEKASALLGMKSTTEYVVSLMNENATKVIAEHGSMIVKNDVFDLFMDACIKVRKPNKALRDAVAFTKNQGIK
jgi:uncharacterized protein (DUF1778 family)